MLLPDGTSINDPQLEYPGFTYPKRSSRLYATKDGDDLAYKTEALTILGFKYGSMIAMAEMILNSQPATLQQVGFRYLQITTPVTLMAAGYSAGVAMSAAVSKSDHPMNHFIGGLTSGVILSACTGNAKRGAMAGVLLGSFAAAVKISYLDDMALFGWQENPRYRLMGTTGHVGGSWDPWRKHVDIEDLYRNKD